MQEYIRRFKLFAEKNAKTNVENSLEMKHQFDIVAITDIETEKFKKRRLLISAICFLFFISSVVTMAEGENIILYIILEISLILFALYYYWYSSAVIPLLRRAHWVAREQINASDELKKELLEINRVITVQSMQSLPERENRAEVARLQKELETELFRAAMRDKDGDVAGAGIARARAAAIESQLRSRGA